MGENIYIKVQLDPVANMNTKLTAILFFFTACVFYGCNTPQPENSAKPNILLICADDLGYSDIGCYGSEVHTPHLDSLANSGIRFTQFHNTSKCFPSRATLITGVYAQQCGYAGTHTNPITHAVTLGEVLKSAGYITLWSGKHHGKENPVTRGFDRYYGLKDGASNYFNPGKQRPGEGKPAQKRDNRAWCIDSAMYQPYTPEAKDFFTTDYFTNYALQWLDEYKNEDKPFFLYLAYKAPHDPLQAWPEDIAKYEGKYMDGYEAIRKKRYEKQIAIGLLDDDYQLSEPTFEPWDSLSDSMKIVEDRKMAVYAAMIDRMDQNIGRVLDKIKSDYDPENTIILFMSDNGASAEVVNIPGYGEIGSMTRWTSLGGNWANVSNTPLRYYKNYSYEGGICTPLIVHWPKGIVQPDRFSDHTGHFIDVMATLIDITGASYPKTFNGESIILYQGESFLPVLKNKPLKRDKPLFWAWSDGKAMRDGKWKIVKEGLDTPWSLFDLEVDPSEINDLAEKYPEIVHRLDSLHNAWQAKFKAQSNGEAL